VATTISDVTAKNKSISIIEAASHKCWDDRQYCNDHAIYCANNA
jgi:hypothetical protein